VSELGVVPSPDSPYLELGDFAQGSRLFRKQILHLNRQFIHPKTGKPIVLGDREWRAMKANFDGKRVTDIVAFPLANDRNQHVENPLANAGLVTALEREGDAVFATIDVRDPAVAERIADGRLPGASAFLHLDAKDPRTGERTGAALLHVCGTLRPTLVDLAPYEEVVAATAEAFDVMPDGSVLPPTVLMLCQSELDDAGRPVLLAADDEDLAPAPEPDYGAPVHDYDYLRDEAARLGLGAQRVSLNLPSRPSYDHVAVEQERRELAGLSAPEITDEDILEATGELAEQHGVSTDAVHVMAHDAHARSGLGRSEAERARVLGAVQVALSRGQLEVSDEQVLALSGGAQASDAEVCG
jgi:hypothetical protein